jgi:glycosyltransferase involved in cell wall biosynthesis
VVNSYMRILFVARAVSIHTARWISQVYGQGWDLHLFDLLGSFPHPELRDITEYSLLFPRRIRPTQGRVSYGHSFFLQHGWDPFPLSLLGYFTRRVFRNRVDRLARLIKDLAPDIIHSIELQAESYPILNVRSLLGGVLPIPWIVSTWGSDIYYYRRFPEHLPKIEAVLSTCDYLIPDCQRDVVLARQHGFGGEIPGVFLGAGGYHLEEMQKYISPGPTATRRIVALKGYHGWAGRALVALEALCRCADVLKNYEIVVYSADPPVEKKVVAIRREGILNIRVMPRSPYDDLLKLLGRARVAIGVSVSDGTPNTMLEAMTMHSFPIQSNPGSISDWINDGVNGLIVDPEDPDSISHALQRAISDDLLVETAIQLNHKLVYEKIDYKIIQPQVVEMYQLVAEHAKAKSGARS